MEVVMKRKAMRGFRMSDDAYACVVKLSRARGYSSPSAFMRAAVEARIESDPRSKIDEAEERIAASVDRIAREIHGVKQAQHATFAFVDALVKTILTCVPEPSGDIYKQAVARARARYDRFLKSVGSGMVGDSHAAMTELVQHGEEQRSS
jgi:hypothetical protein